MDWLLPGLDAATNAHPAFVHFPIALWLTSCAFAWVAALRARDDLLQVARWLLYLGTLAAFAAVATGWLAMGNTPGHGPMWVHKMWMLAATGLAVATCVAAYLFSRSPPRPAARWIVAAGLLATAFVTTLGADRGALLVYRYHIGTTRSPDAAPPGEVRGR